MYRFAKYIPLELRKKAVAQRYTAYLELEDAPPRVEIASIGSIFVTIEHACAIGVMTGTTSPFPRIALGLMVDKGWISQEQSIDPKMERSVTRFVVRFDNGQLLGRDLAVALGVDPEYLEEGKAV